MIRQDLKERGVADEIVERVSAEGDLDRARAILSRKYRQPATTREELAKRARFLQSRGFSYEVIRSVLKVE
jgi:regulatory protein